MHNDEIEKVITEYLRNPKAEYAVMINGEWGSGKTYFLTHSLMRIMETIDNGKDKRRKYAYVSLYGIQNIDEVSKEIVFQCFGKKNKKKVETADAVMETASNILTASLGAVNIDLSKIKDTLAKVNINNWIICFDDLERCCLPINEVLGYMNRLVEHNRCKVIVLANESEIGKITLNQKLEEKYQVVLSGRRLLLNDGSKKDCNEQEKDVKIEHLQKGVKELFNEDILYKSIREKVIGLTIKYEPEMDVVYDSLISECRDINGFKDFLIKNKENILKYFEDEKCYNLRTLIGALGCIQKVYEEMVSNNYNTIKYFDRIMGEFLKYVVLLTIYYRNGGSIKELGLTTEIGYVKLGQNIFSHTRGFKCLEKFCTTLSFSEKEFSKIVATLRQEYEEEDLRREKSKIGKAHAYGDLTYWWEMEDEDVEKLIIKLKEEVQQDKYPFNSYQGIIGQLMQLEYWKYDIGDMDILIEAMNGNIEKAEEPVDIERNSCSFESDPLLRAKYEGYVDKLKLRAGNVNRCIKASEVLEYFKLDNWAEELCSYCDKNYNEFISRYGFIDLLDIDLLSDKMKSATTKEIYAIRDLFKRVYEISNINEFFSNDRERIKEFREKVSQINYQGINKPIAKKTLVEYLDNIIERLEKEVNRYYV